MKLKDILNGQLNATEWEAKGYELPKYDIKAVREKTAKEPTWVHFGGGNIFRAFPAAILNDALNTGKYDRGVIVAETFDFEVIDKAYAPYDNLSLGLEPSGRDFQESIAADDLVHHHREGLHLQRGRPGSWHEAALRYG